MIGCYIAGLLTGIAVTAVVAVAAICIYDDLQNK